MLFSIEETDTGYRLDLPDGSHHQIEGDDEADQNLGRRLIESLGKEMPAKLTLPASRRDGATTEDGDDVPRFDLRGAKSLSDLEDRVSDYLHDNAVAIGKKGLGKLQNVCKDTGFRGKRFARSG